MIAIWTFESTKKAGGYRSLQRGSHGMEPNFVLPASWIIGRFARFGKVIDDLAQHTICSKEMRHCRKENTATARLVRDFLFCKDVNKTAEKNRVGSGNHSSHPFTTPLAPPIEIRALPITRPAPPIRKRDRFLSAMVTAERWRLQFSLIAIGRLVIRAIAILSNKTGLRRPLGVSKAFIFKHFLLLDCLRLSKSLVVRQT